MIDIETLCAFGGHKLTDEQKDICNNMNKSMLVMANPGTGKTTTLRYGLVMATRAFNIKQEKILCMSFTKDATNEIYARYSDLCKKLVITPGIECSTFHSFCYKILRDVLPELKIIDKIDMYTALWNIVTTLKIDIKKTDLKYLVSCVNYTMTRAITDEKKLVNLSVYNKLLGITGITYEDYAAIISKSIYNKLFRKEITQGDIPYFTLLGLLKKPEYLEQLRNKYDLVVVDEFQDMNFIYMIILSKIAKRLIAVGDIKQQIYRFNGSSDNIIDLYKYAYPNAIYKELTQSFRCSTQIAAYASNIIKFNNYDGFTKFSGIYDKDSKINASTRKDFDEKLDSVVNDIRKNNDYYNHMFLYRYQQTGILLLDKLFDNKIPILIKYTPLYKTEFLEDVHLIYQCAADPYNIELVQRLYYKTSFGIKGRKIKALEQAKNQNSNILDAELFIPNTEREFLSKLALLRAGIKRNISAMKVIEYALDIIANYYMDENYFDKLIYSKDYYINCVGIISKGSTWKNFVEREVEKEVAIEQAKALNIGIRFKTLHSAKGLEAENVYILDFDKRSMPNQREFNKLAKMNYLQEACELIRDERCLAFVGITRAKKKLTLIYNDEISLFDNCQYDMNYFEKVDAAYKSDFRDSILVGDTQVSAQINN